MSGDEESLCESSDAYAGQTRAGCDLTSNRLLDPRRELLFLASSLETMCDFAERREQEHVL